MNSSALQDHLGKAVFLDRDGVVNVDSGYVFQPSDIRWIPGVSDAIRLLNKHGYDVYIVTNQSGIARGYYTEEQFLNLSRWMEAKLASKGAIVRQTLYCPHHPTDGAAPYVKECDCRKPKPGMILSALEGGKYDSERCFLIGDKVTDVQAATAAGIRGYLFLGEDLLEFVNRVLDHEEKGTPVSG